MRIPKLTKSQTTTTLAMLLVYVLFALSGCSSSLKRPVLYPNSKYTSAGNTQAQRDIDHCMQMARTHGVSETADGQVGKKAATGAAVAGAAAGAAGLVRGDAIDNAAAGAAAGAAGGAVKGMIDSTETNPTFKRFTNKCLRGLGYSVIGWE